MLIDGGGSSAPSPAAGSSHTVRVDPKAIPGARDAFHEAAKQITDLVSKLTNLAPPNWAGDPVSQTTAVRFDVGDGSTGRQAAIDTLKKYANELTNSGDALQEAHDRYVRVEGRNSEKWRGQGFEDV